MKRIIDYPVSTAQEAKTIMNLLKFTGVYFEQLSINGNAIIRILWPVNYYEDDKIKIFESENETFIKFK